MIPVGVTIYITYLKLFKSQFIHSTVFIEWPLCASMILGAENIEINKKNKSCFHGAYSLDINE